MTVLPGLRVTVVPPVPEPDPARTDVAALLGGFARGPVGVPCRVLSWTEAQQTFGTITGAHLTPYAVRGFFANGGSTAWLIRIGAGGATASATWTVGELAAGKWGPGSPARGGFRHTGYRISATSPGTWAGRTRVRIDFRASSLAGPPAVSLRVTAPGEPAEIFADLPPGDLLARVAASRLIRIEPLPGSAAPARSDTGPLTARWDVVLGDGAEPQVTAAAYAEAIAAQADLPEPALVALPELAADFAEPADRRAVLRGLLTEIAPQRDRLAVLDVTATDPASADDTVAWAATLTGAGETDLRRAVAVYHPAVRVPDPADPGGGLRSVPCAGHVLGVIARLDRERGAHHTPANAALLEVADLDVLLPGPQQALVAGAGINLLRVPAGRGPLIWGGRTLGPDAGFMVHRRLVHLLVRNIRRIAEPLVFETAGPELRFTLVRGITSVLLAAYRSGALAGNRPEQAFEVICDERNNPAGADPASVVCDVRVTPADPMEVIDFRLVLGQDRALEVIEQ
jgi:phage tail sheath protein FI